MINFVTNIISELFLANIKRELMLVSDCQETLGHFRESYAGYPNVQIVDIKSGSGGAHADHVIVYAKTFDKDLVVIPNYTHDIPIIFIQRLDNE